jgi:hypothetical protein
LVEALIALNEMIFRRRLARLRPPLLGLCLAGMAAMTNTGDGRAQQPPTGFSGAFERCYAIKDDAARLHCYENASSASAPNSKSRAASIGTWRLVRTPNPTGGADAISIMQTADVTKSDLDLAGLMLRCGESNVETLVVLIRPFSFYAHPKVTVAAGGKIGQFVATVVPPGSALLLPADATSLAAGPWQSSPELAVEIDGDNPMRGVIPLADLGPAYQMLVTNCRSQ